MRKFIALSILLTSMIGCDDGDIIVTNFDFGVEDLDYCQSGNTQVLYKKSLGNNESLSLNFTSNNFTGTTTELEEGEILEIPLNSTNNVIYRRYGGDLPPNYFCTPIPPPNPSVIEEYYSTGGTVRFITTIVSQDDNDGIPAASEDLNNNGNLFDDDTDVDGIPNFLDVDDDGDGVLTSVERVNPVPGNDEYPDADDDGIPNYLDADDDGDGVPTRNEDANADADPRNDDVNGNGVVDYLDPEASTVYEAYELPENPVTRRFRTVVRILGMTLTNGSETITEANQFEFGIYDTGNVTFTIEPTDVD